MKKRLVAMALAGAMVLGVMTGCGSISGSKGSTASQEGKEEAAPGKGGEAIRIVNGKIEIDGPLKAFAKQYQEKTGQEVVIESLGGGVDINGALKN